MANPSPAADEKHRAPLLWLLGPYLAGLIAACAGTGPLHPAWIGAAVLLAAGAVIFATCAAWRLRLAWLLLLSSAAFVGGVVNMHLALDQRPRWDGLPPREVRLEVELTRLFSPNEAIGRQSVLARIVAAPHPVQDLQGQRIFFSTPLPDASDHAAVLIRSTRLQVHGVLRRLDKASAPRGSFEGYLLSSGIQFRLERAAIESVTRPPRPIAQGLHNLGVRFEAILRHSLPQRHPATGVYVAMFLGQKSELSDSQRESYLRSGTMHLFAISGLHIAVIAGCLHGLLSVMRVPARGAAVLGLLALWIFVEATGGTPSARRAWLMVAFLWIGSAMRRPSNPVASLIAAATLVLVWEPLAVLSTSFQLSYAVVGALLLYGLPLRNRLHRAWQPWRYLPETDWRWWHRGIFHAGRNVLTLAAISWSATLISTPLSLAYFGLASPGAILSNLVLVPVTGFAVTAGFCAIVCGLAAVLPLSGWFNHAAAVILWVVDWLARIAAALPGMFFEGSFSAGWMAPAIVFGLIAMFVAGYAIGWGRIRGSWFAPPLALVVALGFLVTPGSPEQHTEPMKSAYQLAMERLQKSAPDAGPALTAVQKQQLAEIDRVYQGRIAEREIFLRQRLTEAEVAGQLEEAEKIRQQIASERARLEEEREDEKNRVRRSAGERR